ncbi:organic cation transporter 1-like, partial [Limulus polyphemus]|uniref:Organic cation transporter 1-like n=1 Tax=Limulus polyphemus TaxID=6850 RepID=A0ABM1BU59_LIMPO
MKKEQEEGKPEFENILAEVGDYGAFQKSLVRWFLFPGVVPLAWFSLNIVFFMSVPDHWCHVSELLKSNLSVKEQQILIRPVEKQHGVEELSNCEMRDFNYSQILVDLLEGSQVKSILSRYNSTSNIPCPSGWMYDQTLYDNTASKQWDLVCDKDPMPSLVFTLTGVGSVLATPVYGGLSDRIGRKLTFFLCVFVTLVSGIASLFVPNFIAFLVLRMVNGGLSPTLFQLPYILLFEIVGTDKRTEMMTIGSIAWTVGLCTLPLFAYLLRNWVLLGLVTTCFCIPYFLYWRFLPESPRWLVSMKRYDEAVVILTRIAERNGSPVPDNLVERLKNVEKEAAREKQIDTAHNVTVLFRYRNLRKHFIFLTLI